MNQVARPALCYYEAAATREFSPESLECVTTEMSPQVFFAFPQLGENEPIREVRSVVKL